MALPRILLVTADKTFAKLAKAALGGAVVLSMTDSGEKALKALAGTHSFTVVLADMDLAGMDGRAFLAAVKDKHPKITRMAVTGTQEFDLAMALVNTADISWLLTKPCDPKLLATAVSDAVNRYKKEKSESQAMKGTLIGSVKMLVDIMELTHPEAVSRSKRMLRRAQQINRLLKAMSPQLLDMVVLLSNIGCVGLPPELLKKMERGKGLTKEDMKTFRTHPSIAARLLENVPRMGKIAEIIRHQNTPCSQAPPMGSRILKACIDMDQLRTINGATSEQALEHMRVRADIYDPKVIKALAFHIKESKKTECPPVTVDDLTPGMIMQQDMITEDGVVLLQKGEPLSEASQIRIQAFKDLLRIKEPIYASRPAIKACKPPADNG